MGQIEHSGNRSVAGKTSATTSGLGFTGQKIYFTSILHKDPTPDPKPLRRVFVCRNTLGEGREGRVELALEPAQNRRAALKFISQRNNNPGNRLLMDIKSKYVVLGIDYGISSEYDGSILVMEYLVGSPLHQVLSPNSNLKSQVYRNIDTVDNLRVIFLQIALGLKDMFESGIINRDIKPENILVLDKLYTPLQIKIFDFGLAQRFPYSDPSKLVCGTPHFMSPEAAAAGILTPASDIFSFGRLMHDCLTRPSRKDSKKLIYKPDVTYWMKRLISDCTARNPQDRPDISDIIVTLSKDSNFNYLWRKAADNLHERFAKKPTV